MESKSFESTRIVCIPGPTACHKTECAIELAKRINGEIVSADSVQVYLGMDIGSAKPSVEERQGIPHHMIDCVSIDTPEFSVSQYRTMAQEAIDGICSRGKVPIVVGGSGLYLNALTYPLGFAVPRNDEMRARLSAEYDVDPLKSYARLISVDPATAKRLHPNDKKRILRALEVYDCSGKPLSAFGDDFQNETGTQAPYDAILFGLNMDRSRLYERINLRVDRMMRQGLLEEARRIYDANYNPNLPALRSIGYKQLFAYFDGADSLEHAIEQIKQDTRRFAKRQLTWFRRDLRIHWFDATEFESVKDGIYGEMEDLVRLFWKGTIK